MISWLHVAAFGLVVLPGYSAATACRPQLLQVNLAKEVASELRSSRRRYGCDFDGVECIATGGDGGEGVKCSLPAATQATSPRCVPSILQQSLERDIRSELRSAQRKYGCGPASSVRCEKDDPSRPDWVRCHVILLSDTAEDGESSKKKKKATPPAIKPRLSVSRRFLTRNRISLHPSRGIFLGFFICLPLELFFLALWFI